MIHYTSNLGNRVPLPLPKMDGTGVEPPRVSVF